MASRVTHTQKKVLVFLSSLQALAGFPLLCSESEHTLQSAAVTKA